MIKVNTVKIRNAFSDDIQTILALLRDTFQPYQGSYTTEAYVHAILLPADEIQKRLHDPKKLVLVAETDNRIVGTITATFQDNTQVYLQSMAILPRFQRVGIGRLLLEKIEGLAREKGCNRIYFECFEPLRNSIEFYEKQGYRRTGKTIPFYGVTFYEMEKEVD
jgi:N-acetylglutamate synthase-like GNAT family acetyltransferase